MCPCSFWVQVVARLGHVWVKQSTLDGRARVTRQVCGPPDGWYSTPRAARVDCFTETCQGHKHPPFRTRKDTHQGPSETAAFVNHNGIKMLSDENFESKFAGATRD